MNSGRQIDEQLAAFKAGDEKNWARILSAAKRHFDLWAHKRLEPLCNPFKLSYVHFIANVNINGSTNSEVAQQAMIAKQAMGKTIKELEERKLIVLEKSTDDARCNTVKMSESGKELMLGAYKECFDLTEEYKLLVGEERFETAVEVLLEIIKYHEGLAKKD